MQKNCKQCTKQFEVTKEDQSFHEKISPVFNGKKYQIPAPTLCPDCRQTRRLSFRNERKLYNGKCDLCGEQMITVYSADKDLTVYCSKCWWSDNWDPMKFSRDYDFSKTFFEQFAELQELVPRLGMLYFNNENSDYTNYVSNLKNCYLLFSSDFNQDCMYGTWNEYSNNCVDNYLIDGCELTYESFFSSKLYNCIFTIDSSLCRDSAFLYDCKGCSDCYMCYGLRNKQYYIENEQYTKEEYKEEMGKINLGSHEVLEEEKEIFLDFIKDCPRLHLYRNGRIENSTGNFLTDTANCTDCYEILRGKDCKYVQAAFELNNVMDSCYVKGEFGYENCECVPMPTNSAFNLNSYGGSDIFYTDTCMNNCVNIFGCIGLKQKKYCILNKQYSEDEYEKLIPKIIKQMGKNKEWGEFFPIQISPFGYNETNANEYFPKTKEEVIRMEAEWKDEDIKEQNRGPEVQIPDKITNVDNSITDQILVCNKCAKNYKVIFRELEFYKKIGVPIPSKCADCRNTERLQFRNPRKLIDRQCPKCSSQIQTTYAPNSPETVYCEKCYLEAVY